jgi:hypothetical protein
MWLRLRAVLLASSVVLLAAGANGQAGRAQAGGAQAGSAQAGSAQADAEYEAAISQAVIEFAAEHWQEARALFSRAHQHRPSARTLRGLGFCEFELRHYRQADRYLRLALADTRRPLTAEQRADVSSALERAQAFLGRYQLTVEPAGVNATVTVDGAPLQREADGWLVLDVGEHVLIAHGEQRSQRLQIDVRGGERETLRIRLDPTSADTLSSGDSDEAGERRGGEGGLVPWLLIGGGAAAAVAGGVSFALGRADIATVEDAEDGATLAQLEEAHDRAPILTGVGIALALAGVASATAGVVLLQTAAGTSTELALDLAPGAVRLRAGF